MGGSSGGDVTQTSEPWSEAKPYLKKLFSEAERIYGQGRYNSFYGGSTVAPFAPQQQQAMAIMENMGLHGTPEQRAYSSTLQDTMGMGNVNPSQVAFGAATATRALQPGIDLARQAGTMGPTSVAQARQQAGVGYDPAVIREAQTMQNAAGLGMAGSRGFGQLEQTAAGRYLGANPYLSRMFGDAANDVTRKFNESVLPGINATFSAAGRTGSGIQQQMLNSATGELTDSLSQMAGNLYGQNYNNERTRQVQAAGQLGQTAANLTNTAGSLYGQKNALAANLFNTAANRRLQAGGTLGQLGTRGTEQMGDLFDSVNRARLEAGRQVPLLQSLYDSNINKLATVGDTVQGQAQDIIGDALARWDYTQNAPMRRLQDYANAINGVPSFGTMTQTGAGGSRGAGALGGAMAGASIGSMLSLSNPYTALLALGGGILGYQ